MFYDVTIQLQKVDCTLSDFYGSWFLCELKLKKWIQSGVYKNTNLCEKLTRSMDKRKSDLIDNEAMLCTIFLDPRFKANMSMDDTDLTKNILADLWMDLANLNKPSDTDNENNNDIINRNVPATPDEDLLEHFFVERENVRTISPPTIVNENLPLLPRYTNTRDNFITILNDYEINVKRIHHTHCVRRFWIDNKALYPELYEVAMIFLGI